MTSHPVPMRGGSVSIGDLDRPPTERSESRDLAAVRDLNARRGTWTVVLDDDPTGTQTVSDAPIVMGEWNKSDLAWAAKNHDLSFVLTNSRALAPDAAKAITTHAVRTAQDVGASLDRAVRVVSRSDSTLRGHFAAEITAIKDALDGHGRADTRLVFAPAFVEAGRVTARGVQWVGDTEKIPAAQTEFASDTTFPYDEVDLREWVRARLPQELIETRILDLELIRRDSAPERIRQELIKGDRHTVWIAEAVTGSDLASVALGCALAESVGLQVLYRTGPTAVRSLIGQPLPDPWNGSHANARPEANGLIVVGSHTRLTNLQVAELRQSRPIALVEIDARAVVFGDSRTREAEVSRATEEAIEALREGATVLRTSRALVGQRPGEEPIRTSQRVADALAASVRRIAESASLGFVVAKGGITSSDIPTRSFRATRAIVLGQMFPGIAPVWKLVNGDRPDLPLVVFPGNVGDSRSLAVAVSRFSEGEACA